MALDAATIIRAGSAALLTVSGLAIIAIARHNKGAVSIGAMLVFFGTPSLLNNLFRDAQSDWMYVVVLATVMGFGAAAIAAAILVPGPLQPRERRAFMAGLGVGLACLVGLLSYGNSPAAILEAIGDDAHPGWMRFLVLASTAAFLVGIATLLCTASIRLAMAPPTDRRDWLHGSAAIFMVGPFFVFYAPVSLDRPESPWALVMTIILVVGLTVPWLVAAARAGSRMALGVALFWPALGLVSYLYMLVPGNDESNFFDIYGILGVLRLIGWSFLVYAILQADLLRVKLPRVAVNKGAVAAGALATLFIVAQVAQNFFSAKYGLLTGGIIAGTFLFAASPVQRSFERLGEKGPAGGSRGRASPSRVGKEQEAAYRDAVRLAWRDRRFEPAEEIALANLADRLGLTAMRAIEIRLAVEKERGVR